MSITEDQDSTYRHVRYELDGPVSATRWRQLADQLREQIGEQTIETTRGGYNAKNFFDESALYTALHQEPHVAAQEADYARTRALHLMWIDQSAAAIFINDIADTMARHDRAWQYENGHVYAPAVPGSAYDVDHPAVTTSTPDVLYDAASAPGPKRTWMEDAVALGRGEAPLPVDEATLASKNFTLAVIIAADRTYEDEYVERLTKAQVGELIDSPTFLGNVRQIARAANRRPDQASIAAAVARDNAAGITTQALRAGGEHTITSAQAHLRNAFFSPGVDPQVAIATAVTMDARLTLLQDEGIDLITAQRKAYEAKIAPQRAREAEAQHVSAFELD